MSFVARGSRWTATAEPPPTTNSMPASDNAESISLNSGSNVIPPHRVGVERQVAHHRNPPRGREPLVLGVMLRLLTEAILPNPWSERPAPSFDRRRGGVGKRCPAELTDGLAAAHAGAETTDALGFRPGIDRIEERLRKRELDNRVSRDGARAWPDPA